MDPTSLLLHPVPVDYTTKLLSSAKNNLIKNNAKFRKFVIKWNSVGLTSSLELAEGSQVRGGGGGGVIGLRTYGDVLLENLLSPSQIPNIISISSIISLNNTLSLSFFKQNCLLLPTALVICMKCIRKWKDVAIQTIKITFAETKWPTATSRGQNDKYEPRYGADCTK